LISAVGNVILGKGHMQTAYISAVSWPPSIPRLCCIALPIGNTDEHRT